MSPRAITLQLEDDVYAELEVLARNGGEDVAQAAQHAIREYLRSYMLQMEAEGGFPQA